MWKGISTRSIKLVKAVQRVKDVLAYSWTNFRPKFFHRSPTWTGLCPKHNHSLLIHIQRLEIFGTLFVLGSQILILPRVCVLGLVPHLKSADLLLLLHIRSFSTWPRPCCSRATVSFRRYFKISRHHSEDIYQDIKISFSKFIKIISLLRTCIPQICLGLVKIKGSQRGAVKAWYTLCIMSK